MEGGKGRPIRKGGAAVAKIREKKSNHNENQRKVYEVNEERESRKEGGGQECDKQLTRAGREQQGMVTRNRSEKGNFETIPKS